MSDEPSTIAHIDETCGAHAVIVIGGHQPDRRALATLPEKYTVICADSGLDHARRLGLDPEVVIGDMDSVDPSNLIAARSRGCEIVEHARDKDLTDTELAIELAVDRGFRTITMLWGGGDRIDHILGVIAALGHQRLALVDRVRAWVAADRVDVIHAGRTVLIDHEPNSTISLLVIGSGGAVVTTRGLKWNLDDEALSGDRARGLSNVIASMPASIHCRRGVIAAISPDHLSTLEGTLGS